MDDTIGNHTTRCDAIGKIFRMYVRTDKGSVCTVYILYAVLKCSSCTPVALLSCCHMCVESGDSYQNTRNFFGPLPSRAVLSS